jgi:hypothetical protein
MWPPFVPSSNALSVENILPAFSNSYWYLVGQQLVLVSLAEPHAEKPIDQEG